MKTLIAVGILVLSAAVARAGYLVELDGGDRMTVDSYWEDGGKVHLMQGGVDMIVPKSRVRSISAAADDDTKREARPAPAAAPRRSTDSAVLEEESREDLERKQRGIEKHLLRVQALRFESEARGDDPKETKRLEREFKRTQQRRSDVIRELESRTDEE